MKVALFGIPRSGTNVVRHVLEHQLGHTVLEGGPYGDKHVLPPRRMANHMSNLQQIDAGVGMVAVVKSPTMWVASWHRYARQQVDQHPEGCSWPAKRHVEGWVGRWTGYARAYADLVPHGLGILRYHRLLDDPPAELHRALGLPVDAGEVSWPARQLSRAHPDDEAFDLDRYREGYWVHDVPRVAWEYLGHWFGLAPHRQLLDDLALNVPHLDGEGKAPAPVG